MSRLRPGVTLALLSFVAAALADDDAKKPAPAPAADSKDAPADAAAVAKMTPEERAKHLTAALEGLTKDVAEIRTLKASFVQTKRLEVFGGDVETKGTLKLRLPDRFAWETTEPLKSVLVVNGDKAVRRRTSRKGVVTETKFDLKEDPVTAATVQQVFLWTSGDLAKASGGYALDLVSEAPMTVKAVPTDERMKKVIASVTLEFSERPSHLAKVVLAEQTGDTTEIAFSGVERNPDLADDVFAIERTK
jgi:outer membrane lipoprotein-sorting protein